MILPQNHLPFMSTIHQIILSRRCWLGKLLDTWSPKFQIHTDLLRLLNKSLQLDPHNKLQKTSSKGTLKFIISAEWVLQLTRLELASASFIARNWSIKGNTGNYARAICNEIYLSLLVCHKNWDKEHWDIHWLLEINFNLGDTWVYFIFSNIISIQKLCFDEKI